jgi:hypothetical protein
MVSVDIGLPTTEEDERPGEEGHMVNLADSQVERIAFSITASSSESVASGLVCA